METTVLASVLDPIHGWIYNGKTVDSLSSDLGQVFTSVLKCYQPLVASIDKYICG